MSGGLYTDLSWLPRPAPDFDTACRALAADAAPGPAILRLAGFGLDENRLGRLGRAILKAASLGLPLAPLLPFRLALVGNATLDLLVPVLVASAARHGIALECVTADYGQAVQAALDPASALNRARPDAVLLAIDHRGLALRCEAGDAEGEAADIASGLAQLETIRRGIRANCGAPCIVQTLAPPPETLFGSYERVVPGTAWRVIEGLNAALRGSIAGSGDLLLDVANLAATVGLDLWHAPLLWNLAKLGFDPRCMPIYAEHVARLIAARLGRSRKCLVLDLDNTLWGGVIGDDGVDGILIGQGDATGEAHLAVQILALQLRRRGIVLAVSSKNTDEVARAPFREHPDMLLREEHVSVFQANWDDKATNLVAIAGALNLGLDALVLLDDNPAERALVRRMLPRVAVPELPDDPAWFARTLSAAGYFEALAFSDEDRARADMYSANASRVALGAQAGDIDAYLASLDMEIAFAPFDRIGRARIAQLIGKSNQFNLTTRRYGEAEVAAADEDPAVFTLQVRLSDAFGDNGMIAVVICRPGGAGCWTIDTWLMSCRVLGRHVEQAVLAEILAAAREAGIALVTGTYIPTAKNGLVRDHYRSLGFTPVSGEEGGTTVWAIGTDAEIAPVPMRIVRGLQAARAA